MLNFDKMYDIRRALENIVRNDDLIRAVFDDIPELENISFSCTNEYDDNNYSDYTRLTAVNDWKIYDDEYDDEEKQDSDLPKIEVKKVQTIRDLVEIVGKDFGYGEDHTITRAYAYRHKRGKKSAEEKAEMKYILNQVMGKKIKENFFVKASPKWAVYHAAEHGRFSREAEFKIFAKEGRMYDAFRYAREVLKGSLDEKVENFFILNSQPDSQDYEELKEYLEFKKNLEQTAIN
jgi:hypothetical protein